MDKPSPIPCCLVLKKESNSLGRPRRNPMTTILHGDSDVAVSAFHQHLDQAPVLRQIRHRIHRIEHEVDQHLLNLRLITRDVDRRERRDEHRA